MNQVVNRVGERYGRLTVTGFAGFREHEKSARRSVWNCMCDCGKAHSVTAKALVAGVSLSCGCYQKEQVSKSARTHGRSKTNLYKCWSAMKRRCHNPSDAQYENYGARGIAVCDEWRTSFEAFAAYIGEIPAGLSIDRINNDKGYEPGNVRLATASQQLNNRRTNVRMTHNGETLTLTEWSVKLGIGKNTLRQRYIVNRWSVHDSLTKPVDARYAHRSASRSATSAAVAR